MANIVRFDSKPVFTDPVFIEALPGIGDVGKTAGDFIAESMEAVKFASIYSEDFPPHVTVDDDSVVHMASNELWYARFGGRDFIFLRGDYQGSTPVGQFYLAQDLVDTLLSYGVSKIITLGGYGTGEMICEPRVFGAVSKKELKENLETCGVTFSPGDPQTGIVGASGLLIGMGKIYGVDSFCLMGETPGYFVDHRSALAVVRVLMKALDFEIDTKDLEEKAVHIDTLTAKVKEFEGQTKCGDLNYIG